MHRAFEEYKVLRSVTPPEYGFHVMIVIQESYYITQRGDAEMKGSHLDLCFSYFWGENES